MSETPQGPAPPAGLFCFRNGLVPNTPINGCVLPEAPQWFAVHPGPVTSICFMFKDFTYARDMPAVLAESCTYTRRTPASSRIMVNVPSCLPPLPDMPIKTQSFRILDPGPVQLRGFRAYTTAQNTFFLDESLDPGWGKARYANVFAERNGRFEDYEARILDDVAQLPDLSVDKTIDEPVISLCSAEPANYGSWIYRILPKLAALPLDDRALFVYAHSPWQQAMLQHFAPDRRFIGQYPRLSYHLLEAQIPTMRNVGVNFDDQTRAFYHRHAAAIPGTSDLRRIYLTRRNQPIRPMLNEAEMEAELINRGFHVIHPEDLPLPDRIRVIRDAEVIVCPGGSGLFNLVFAINAKLVLDIEASKTWIAAHTRLINSLELPHIVLIGDQVQ
ncbi:MAG: glycosyltransferase family 61 protein, partial [Rhodobacterales bacterium]|nr:glycosyltransferase family 61 protein [Rhodobacterales bacterium]